MKKQNKKLRRFLRLSIAVLIVWCAWCQPTACAQSLKPSKSAEDSLNECYQTALILDARLAICEQAHADSLLARKVERAMFAKDKRKAVRSAKWAGVKWGFLGGIIATIALMII